MGHVGAVGAPIRVSGGARVVSRGSLSHLRVGTGPVRVTRRPRPSSSGTVFNRPFDFNNEDDFGAPGLGFDEVHNRAVHPRRDRDDRFRFRNNFGAFFPFFDGGFFLPSAPFVDDTGVEVPPEEAAADEAPEPPHGRTHYREREQYEPPVVSHEVAPEPQAKTEEYVFVRRDGTLFFAVAYTWDQGTLRYITSEGVRRSVTRDALDLDATQQFNEQRGMSFHSPA